MPSTPAPSAQPDTLLDVLLHGVQRRPAALAVVDPLGTLDYRGLLQQVERMGLALRAQGLTRDSRIAVASTSGPAMGRLLLGVMAHAVSVPLDPALDATTAGALFQRLKLSVLIIDGPGGEGLREAAHRSGTRLLEARAGALSDGPGPGRQPGPPAEPLAPLPSGDSVAYILSSSGTTGRPKLVPRTHRSLFAGLRMRARMSDMQESDVDINLMPLYHAMGFSNLLFALVAGATSVCLGRFDFAEFAEWAQRTRATMLAASPVVLEELAAAAQSQPQALAGWRPVLIGSASSALKPAVLEALVAQFGARVIVHYGMTEASVNAGGYLTDPQHPRGSTGRPALAEVRIIDPQGATLPANALGEIVLRGPGIFDGYLDDPALTAASFIEGWFRTGDLGRLDSDGYLFLEGRLVEVINRGGAKVSAREVEQWLADQPGVARAVVFPVPHASLGEDVMAAVVPRPGVAVNARELRLAMLEALPGYKVPSQIAVVDALPLGPAGKVRREGLAGLLKDALQPARREPVSDNERLAAALVSEVLRGAPVGMDDNFFSLGGHSLLAVRMLARLEERSGRRITPAAFMRDPSAAGMAALLEQAAQERYHRAIEPYREGDGRAPLFFAPGYDGHTHDVRQLIPFLDPRIGVLGLSTPEALTLSDDPIGAIAAECVARIREVQPHGPYRLAGYSFGGMVAQAVACGLEAMGQTVSLLFLIDSVAPLDRLSRPPRTHSDRLALASARHAFQVYGGRTTLVRSWERPFVEVHMPGLGWEHLSAAGVAVYDVPTTHYGAIFAQQTSRSGVLLARLLAAADAGTDPQAPAAPPPDLDLEHRPLPPGFFEARLLAAAGRHADALRVVCGLPAGSLPGWALPWMQRLLPGVAPDTPGLPAVRAEQLATLEAKVCGEPWSGAGRLMVELEQGRFEQALALLAPERTVQMRAQTRWLAQAMVASRAGWQPRARAALTELERSIHDRPDLQATLIKAVWGQRPLRELSPAQQAALARCSPPVQAELAGWFCKVALRQGDWAAAVRHGNASVDGLPDVSAVYPRLILALVKLGRGDEAARRYQQALERFPARWGYRELLDRALAGQP